MANHFARTALLMTAGIACSGCVALWQSDHKIEASTGWAVTIEYDPLLLKPGRVALAAQAECRKFQRIAVFDQVRKGPTWTRIADFHCDNDPVALKNAIASAASSGTTYRSLPLPFAAAAPQVATSKAAPLPAVPPLATSSGGTPTGASTQVAPTQITSVQVIDARGPNSGVTRKQVAKLQIAKEKAARTQIARAQTVSVPVRSLKARNAPVASLKRSILS